MDDPARRLIEVDLTVGDTLFARSAGGREAPCSPHPDLPRIHVLDTRALTPGEPYRYVVRGFDGRERGERYFNHSIDQGGPVDVWEGIRAIDGASQVAEIRRRFEAHGFAVVPAVLSADVVRGALSITRPMVEAAWGPGGAAAVKDKLNLEKVLMLVPYLLQALAEKTGPLLSALVGPQVFLSYEQVMVVRAKSDYVTRRHRDADGGRAPMSEASARDKRSVHLWIPLVDVDESRASMVVEPLSDPARSIPLRMRAGDALFLHNEVWHGAGANTSDEHRFSWLLNLTPRPIYDVTNPGADLDLPLVSYGSPSDLSPGVCERRYRERPGFLDLFSGFYTYDAKGAEMVNPDNRAGER